MKLCYLERKSTNQAHSCPPPLSPRKKEIFIAKCYSLINKSENTVYSWFQVISRRFWRGLHFVLLAGSCTKRRPWSNSLILANLVAPCFFFGRESCSSRFQMFSKRFWRGLRIWVLGLQSSFCTHPLRKWAVMKYYLPVTSAILLRPQDTQDQNPSTNNFRKQVAYLTGTSWASVVSIVWWRQMDSEILWILAKTRKERYSFNSKNLHEKLPFHLTSYHRTQPFSINF